MSRRARLGQHFLASAGVAEEIAAEAGITPSDTVLEVGTGLGVLTRPLCRRAGRVISVEADGGLAAEAAAAMSGIGNLEVRHGDGLRFAGRFDVFVSNLPYSASRGAFEWLARTPFSRGAVMVQREFADKLAARGRERRAISVVASHAFEVRRVRGVGRDCFDPPPRVDSVVLGLRRRNLMTAAQVRAVNRMFSYRRKTLANVLARAGAAPGRGPGRRLDEMDAGEIVGLAAGALR